VRRGAASRRSKRPSTKEVSGAGRRWKVVWGAAAGAALATLAAWYVAIPYPWTLRTRNPERTAVMEQRIREAADRGETLEVRHTWIPLSDVSDRLVRAVLVAEDYRFRQHSGVDWVSLAEEVRWTGDDSFSWTSVSDLRALREALAYAWTNRSELRGRSTITQQLAKNLYFGTDRSFARKAMELVVAKRLERRLGKDRILELYLNVAEWGPGIFGAEEAAREYFGRSASDLTLEQAAALAATLPHPLTSNPARSPGRMLWRRNLILERIAPASGIPPAPAPLPDPEIVIPELDLPEIEPLPPEAAATDTVSPSLESAAGDSLGVTAPAPEPATLGRSDP
jgi:monofunctional biosynthetic peptidoglycan transglycosylase